MDVIRVRENPGCAKMAIAYFQSKWAGEDSRMVYEDSITRSLSAKGPLPQWYLLEDAGEIIGCAGLITNDFISCGDLWPWLCALYIEKGRRGRNLAGLLIERAKHDAAALGFENLYLCTDHVGYYERFGFAYVAKGYHPWGESSRVYECEL